MKWIKTAAMLTCSLLMTNISMWAQSPSTETDFLASTGKIYVVVLVIIVIFIGILALLISLERRLARLERSERLKGE